MNLSRIVIKTIMIFSFFSTVAFAENTPPSNDIIQSWWKKNSTEEMTIEGKPEPIGLRNKEIAYLVPVGFYSRGRNSTWHIVMVRPDIKEARELDEAVGRDFIVHDFNHDAISEVETTYVCSGQGTTIGVKSIVHFDDWQPIFLYQKKFHDNLGCCGPSEPEQLRGRPCESIEIKWEFIDFDGDGGDDLIENIITMKGPQENKLKTEKTINKFPFKDNTFAQIINFEGLNLKPTNPDEPIYYTLNKRLSVENSLNSLKHADSALESFKKITAMAKDKIQKEKLNDIGNTDWETQNLGFSNWINTIKGTLIKQEYLIKKLNYDLALNNYKAKKISIEKLLNTENELKQAGKRFQKWWNSFSIAD